MKRETRAFLFVVMLLIGLFLGHLSTKDVFSACACGGTYCFSGCDFEWCPGAQYATSTVNGIAGSCLVDDMCQYGDVPGSYVVGCTNPPWTTTVRCGDCPGGYFDDTLPLISATTEDCLTTSCLGGGSGCGEIYGVSDRGCGNGCPETQRLYSQGSELCPTNYWCATPSSDHPCSCEPGNGIRIVESTGLQTEAQVANVSVSYRRTNTPSGGVISDSLDSGDSCESDYLRLRTYGGLIPVQTGISPRGYIFLNAGSYEFRSSGCKVRPTCMADPCWENWCFQGRNEVRLSVNSNWIIGNDTTFVSYGGTWNTGCDPSDINSSQITVGVSGWYPFQFDIRYRPITNSTLTYRQVGTATWLPITYDMLSSCGPLTPPNSPPTCSISGPTSATATYPLQYTIQANDPDSNLNAVAINYSLNSPTPSWASPPIPTQGFSPTSSTSRVFNIPGLAPGTYYVGCNAYDSASARCSFNPWCEWTPSPPDIYTCGPSWVDCAPDGSPGSTDYILLTVNSYINPWFQAVGGNVVTKGNISSPIPTTAYNLNFIRDPVGLLIYSGTLSLGSGTTSSTGVTANTVTHSKPEASFDLFYNKKTPEDVKTAMTKLTSSNSISASSLSSCNTVRGYKVCYYDGAYNPGSGALGNLTLTGNYTVVDGDRIILFVDNASVTIQGNIRPQTRGLSSFLVISEGVASASPGDPGVGIVVGTTVGGTGTFTDTIPDLEGVFYTDRTFVTSHTTGVEDRNLHIRGSVVAGSFSIGRDLGSGATGEKNDRYPAEYFEYGTEQVMAFPPFLRLRSTSWSEVAP